MSTRRRLLRVGGGGVALGLAVAAAAALQSGPSGHGAATPVRVVAPPAAATAAAPTAAAFAATAPAPEPDSRFRLDAPGRPSTWATVERAVAARSQPSARARVVGRIRSRTPEGTTGDVLLLERAIVSGRIWLRVRLPILPNGSTGWVPRDALGSYHEVTTRLLIDTRRLRVTLYDRGRVVFTAPAGVGKATTPTPTGQFYIRNVLAGFGGAAFYGPVAFGTSARSAVLTDWPAGGYIGIHGTNAPQLVPGRISHGCVRLRNADIVRLARLLPVGSPVTIA